MRRDEELLPDIRTAAVDPLQKVCFLQSQIEKGIIKVPEQDVPKRFTLIGKEAIPQRQGGPIPGNSQEENCANGYTIVKKSLLAPGSTYHLKE